MISTATPILASLKWLTTRICMARISATLPKTLKWIAVRTAKIWITGMICRGSLTSQATLNHTILQSTAKSRVVWARRRLGRPLAIGIIQGSQTKCWTKHTHLIQKCNLLSKTTHLPNAFAAPAVKMPSTPLAEMSLFPSWPWRYQC
mgnify:FL=1